MGEEDITNINLFGVGEDEPSKEGNAASDEELDQSSNIDHTSADADTAISIAAPGNPASSGPLPTPPKANADEKVDTSKLDAELAKAKPNVSQSSQALSPVNSSKGEQHVANESDEEDDDSEASSADDEEEDAQEKDDEPDESDEEDDDSEASSADDEEEASNTNVAKKLDEKANTAKKSDLLDPKFAEKITRDVHADENAPQADTVSVGPMPSLTASSVDYKEPSISELKKRPTLEKKADVYSSIPVEKMPITLTFETGRQKITLGELEKVKAGYTFECSNPVNAPVTICANDTPIGTGELLDVDGRVGVRIIEFYNK